MTPQALLRHAVSEVPALRYAMGVGGVAAIVSIILTGWKLEPGTAVAGGLVVFIAMVALVIFSALSRTGPRLLKPLALFLAWSFLILTVAVSGLFVSCAFFDKPKALPCLLGNCEGPGSAGSDPVEELGKQVTPEPDEPKASDYATEVSASKKLLSKIYGGEFQTAYDQFAQAVRDSMSFVQFRDAGRRQFAQVSGGPLHRKLKFHNEQAGYLVVAFESEFDEMSLWLEGVTFVKTPVGWEPYRVDIQPSAWAQAGPRARVLPDSSPRALITRVDRESLDPATLVGSWLPPSGWRARAVATLSKKGERTCDVELSSGPVNLVARALLGGCGLARGTSIEVVGKLTAINAQKIELSDVRFLPSDT